jgi:hypothetical protein
VQLEKWEIYMQAQHMLLLGRKYARSYASGIQAIQTSFQTGIPVLSPFK